MTVDEFVWAVTGSGTSNFMDEDEIEDYCPVHGDAGMGGWLKRRISDIGRILGQ